MGQEISLQQKSQQVFEHINEPSKTTSKQGFLKISQYPFPHSMKIASSDSYTSIYAQKCKNLQQQIIYRKAHRKYFSKPQILDFIQSTVYTLVSLQQQGIIYKDITSQNIFVIEQKSKTNKPSQIKCKILPNHLIEQTAFQRLQRINKRVIQQQKCFTFSPQMIIALRARQKQFNDLSLVKKSSVFALGMVLLEAATLKLSCDFYDTVTFDIYEEVIEKCLEDVQQRYGTVVVRIIANMIDFDFQERIEGFTQLAKWIIYEIQNSEQENTKTLEEQNLSSMKSMPIIFSQRSLNQQNIQTLPVCLENINTKKGTQPIQPPSKTDKQKQNIQIQNKINIKVREVSVYLEKNSNLQNDKQNKSRLLYSPFLSTSSDDKGDFDLRVNPKLDLVKQYSRRGLAFEQAVKKTKRNTFVDNLMPLSNYLRTHR